jgi:hypothetical protein
MNRPSFVSGLRARSVASPLSIGQARIPGEME